MNEEDIVKNFHKLYYGNGGRTLSGNTTWLGYKVLKCPFDLWIYQEIIYEIKPDIIIETGTGNGGGALFFASICDFIGNGTVLSIDTENTNHKKELPNHKRILYITGSSVTVSNDVVNAIISIRKRIREKDRGDESFCIMAILDSKHEKDYVLQEMRIYGDLVSIGSYLIVEDTNLDKYCNTGFEGPLFAVEEFLRESDMFIIDKSKNKFYLSFNPDGYLKKVKD